jgi:hypothetical protein
LDFLTRLSGGSCALTGGRLSIGAFERSIDDLLGLFHR